MSLMVFLAICILGVDVLIYFLYEWAFGESERIRKRHPRCRFERFPVEISAATKPRSDANRAASTVIEMHPVNSTPLPSVPKPRSASLIVASPRPTPPSSAAPNAINATMLAPGFLRAILSQGCSFASGETEKSQEIGKERSAGSAGNVIVSIAVEEYPHRPRVNRKFVHDYQPPRPGERLYCT